MTSSVNPTHHKAEMRRHLLSVAQDLFAERGFDAISPADISAVASIGRTTFYEYFTDKEDLLAALVEQRLPEVTAELIASISRNVGARDQLAELAVRLVEFAATDHALGIRLHQGLPALGADAQRRIGAAHQDLSTEFARLYAAAVQEGELRSIPYDLAGLFVQDLIFAAAKALIALDEPKSRFHEVADELVAFLFNGLSVN